jgi:trans-2,3-dihydro-3-hydroxyanthranilate isomerase
VFVLPPTKDGDHRLRIFTPARELPFAGHPTIGTAYLLAGGRDASLRLEENVGTLHVTVRDGFTEMEQPLPMFQPGPDRATIAPLLSLAPSDIDPSLPIEVGSSGNAFTFLPVHDLAVVKKAMPARGLDQPTYIFTRETLAPSSTVHGRLFAGSFGIAEDPATGSAVGPLGAYLVRHGLSDGRRIVVEQGNEMGRPSLLYVRVGGDRDRITGVHVGGHAVVTGGGWIEL